MSNERIYHNRENYLLEIDFPFHHSGKETIYSTWYWEVHVVYRESEYKVMAVERNRNKIVPWTTLVETTYQKEILKLCREKMIG